MENKQLNNNQTENKQEVVPNEKDSPKSVIKVISITSLIFIAALAAIIGGIAIVFDSNYIGVFLAAIGGLTIYVCGSILKRQYGLVHYYLHDESENRKIMKRKIFKFSATIVSSFVFIIAAVVVGYGIMSATYLNEWASELVALNVDENIYSEIDDFDEYYETELPITLLFYQYEDEVAELKKEADAFLDEKAAEIETAIDNLKPCKKLSSYQEYVEKNNEIMALTLDAGDEFENRVLEKVDNYDEYEKIKNDFLTLCQKYKRTCGSCGGSGSKKVSCGSCGGRGKNVVTWYSEGDWGEKSYTSYTCTKCNGSGGRRISCGRCSGGYVYDFD